MMSLRRSARVSAARDVEHALTRPLGSPSQLDTNGASRTNGIRKVQKSNGAKPSSTSSASPFKVPSAPATPKRNRIAKAKIAPPITPTPSLVGLITANYSTGDVDDTTPPPLDRPVEPHQTNATLVTPGGTQQVAYPNGIPDSSPSKTGLPRPTTTTGSLLEEACAHLVKMDSRLKPLVDKHACRIFSPEGLAEEIDPFRALSSGIIAQQVSGAAAKSIKNKFIGLFNHHATDDGVMTGSMATFPSPALVAKTDLTRLREAGLSQRKAEYIQGLAEKFASGELSTHMLLKGTDEEVMEKLIAVRGLGKWSVEMFACFGLKRMDVFSTGDLGVQ